MPQLIKPGQVKILTKDGECQVAITLELTINLNSDGLVVAQAQAKTTKEEPVSQPIEEMEEKTAWAIPEFVATPRINFGKKE